MLIPPARASTRTPLAPLSCVPHGDAVSVACSHPSSSVSASEASSLPLLHPSLSVSPPSPIRPSSREPLRLLAPLLALLSPARPIADTFVLTGDIGGRGRGQEREERGEQPQGLEGGGEEQGRGGGQERGMDRGERWRFGRRDRKMRVGTCHADSVAMGHARKRGKRAKGGCAFRREQRPESPLRDGRRAGDAGPPWGMGAKGGKRRPA